MATRFTRTCIVCGKEYEYCNGCSRFNHVETWHNIYHDENCRKIFNIASNYHAGKLSREEAAKAFSECDLSNKENLKPSIRKLIDELIVEKLAKTIEEVVPTVSEFTEILPEEVIEQLPSETEEPIKKRGQRRKMKIMEETALNSDFE